MSAASAIQPWSARGTAAIASSKERSAPSRVQRSGASTATSMPASRRGRRSRPPWEETHQPSSVGGHERVEGTVLRHRRGGVKSNGRTAGAAGPPMRVRRGRSSGESGGFEATLRRSSEPWFTSIRHPCPTAPPSAPRPERAATRERVVDAARALIAHGGYREAQVAAVARRAGVATGTVYRHFPSKADLFAEVFRAVSQREVDAARAPRPTPAPRSTATRTARGRHRDVRPPRPPRPPPGLGAAGRAGRTRRRGRAARVPPRPRRAFAAILADGIASGELPDQDADLVGAALVGALGEALVGPLSPVAPPGRPRRRSIAKLVTFCLRSVTDAQDAACHARP